MINADQINAILGIDESYKAPTAIMKLLFDKEKREEAFRSFLEIEHDLTRDAFHAYFEEQQANKRKYAQDFTPDSISNLLTKIVPSNGKTLDVATGSGALIIAKWHADRMNCGIADKELLKMYAEDYIKEHFEMSEKDGWIRRLESDESKI